mmetsp:Transcript_13204/g.15124  ORF Transcript_13204/g.15124 Transcript_13204/m.15124 type:complete len:330 (-) Transcript_13204:301-1290(-)
MMIEYYNRPKKRSREEGSKITPFINNLLLNVEGNDDIFGKVLSYLDVVTLTKKKLICIRWKYLCYKVITLKSLSSKIPFVSNRKLDLAVDDYIHIKEGSNDDHNCVYDSYHKDDDTGSPVVITRRDRAEEIATLYGWPIDQWDVSKVEDFSELFFNRDEFNEDIGSWDVSNAKYMSGMFERASSFNRDISLWNTMNVEVMDGMFSEATSFNQDVSSWDTNRVEDMGGMFSGSSSFDQNLSLWDTSNVTNMGSMFCNAASFRGKGLSNWLTVNVIDMSSMFEDATIFNEDISSWDTSDVKYTKDMFQNAQSFEHDLSLFWNTSNVVDSHL